MVDAVGAGSSLDNFQRNFFSRIDTNSNRRISQEEFVIGRPDNVSRTEAAELFSELDTDNTGSLTQNQIPFPSPSSFANDTITLSDEALALLQQDSIRTNAPSADEIFARIDSNNDGLASLEEFVNGRPANVSEEDAQNLFTTIDEDGDGFVTQENIASFNQSLNEATAAEGNRPPPPPPPPASASEEDSEDEEEYDALDTNEDGVVSADELSAASTETTNPALAFLFEQAIRAYTSS